MGVVQIADRSVSVILKANVTGLVAGFKTAGQAAQDFGTKGLDAVGRNEQHINTLTTGVGALGIAMVGAAALAVKKFADFDQAMSNVAATGQDARDSIDLLRVAAIDAGKRTVFSASEAANAIEELGKAGVSAADILGGGLNGSLDLAAAGGIGVAEAAGIAAVALKQFGLRGSDMTHVSDLLAAGAGKAMGGVSDLGMALKQAGLVANQTGLTIEETTAGLSAFASAGMIGSDAGTSFKAMLQRLTPQSAEAQKAMDDLGISAYDSQGKFIGLSEFAGNLQTSMKNLTPEARNAAMSVIFGSDAVRAASVLYTEGSAGIDKWTAAVNDQGYAAKTAATRLNNLKGDIEQLSGSVETMLINFGAGADGPLRSLTQGLTSVVNQLADMSPAAQTATLGIVGVGGIVALSVAGVGKFAIGLNNTKEALKGIGVSGKTAGVAMVGLGAVLAIGAVALGAWAAEAARAKAMGDELGQTLDKTGRVTDKTGDTIRKMLAETRSISFLNFDSAYTEAEKMGISFQTLSDYVLGTAGAVDTVNKAGDEYIGKSSVWEHVIQSHESSVANLEYTLDTMKNSLTDAQRAELQKITADEAAKKSEGALKDSYDWTSAAVDKQVVSLEDLLKIQGDLAKVNMSEAEAEAAWAQQVIDNRGALEGLNKLIDMHSAKTRAATDAVTAGGASLDLYTEAGQFASSALLGTSNAAWALLDAAQKAGASTEELKTKTQTARDEFITTAMQMGLNAEAAAALADKYGLVPGKIVTQAELDKAQADADLDALKAKVLALPGGVVSITTVGAAGVYDYLTLVQDAMNRINNTHVRVAMGAGGSGGQTFATGGRITGPGTGTSDSIPLWGSNGEYMVKAQAVSHYGPAMFDSLNAMRFAGGGSVGGGSRSSGSPAASMPPIYVQNPFTGEYLLAQVASVAGGVVASAQASRTLAMAGGSR